MTAILITAFVALAAVSFATAPRVRTAGGFFLGWGDSGVQPRLWTLVLSQVTTWIFARSLLNAAILGYFFGIAGVLGYAVYYGSFLVGGWAIDLLRFRHGHGSVQGYLAAQFGRLGSWSYNAVVAVRLVSEVFANLLVVGLLFGAAGTPAHTAAILAVAACALAYSMLGGLSASLRTDVIQMSLLVGLLAAALAIVVLRPDFDALSVLGSSPELANPGWALVAVGALQVLSYPLHDPVMMDRGFLADRQTTRRSFYHAFWIAVLGILAFGVIGVYAGQHALAGEGFLATLERLLATPGFAVVAVALLLSALSTLDSTLSSAAKLFVVEMGLGGRRVAAGRWAMLGFMLAGLAMLFAGPDELFAAVAVSGTAALFLAPVLVLGLWRGWQVARWSYVASFAVALAGAAVYFLVTSGYLPGIPGWHKYALLLVISAGTLAFGFGAFALGRQRSC